MGPLERLPDNALPEAIRQRLNDAQELKGAFQSIGSSSVVTHRIFSGDTFDIQFDPSTTPGAIRAHQADVEFIPDDMTLGGAYCHQVHARYLDTSNNPATWFFQWFERVPSTDGKQKWRFYHVSFGYPTDAVRLKFFFFTTGSGTFTANVII